MIRRQDIRELAQFQSGEGSALSFYFQPRTPSNKSHREEAILAKDLVRAALREVDKNGKGRSARADLDRILEIAERLHGNQARAKAIFACSEHGFWREFDLPPRLSGSSVAVNQRFHLRPLAAILGSLYRAAVVLVNRKQARRFGLTLDDIAEREEITAELPRRGRSDGFAGYDAGHAQRHVEHEAMHHFKAVAERMKELYDTGVSGNFIIGCRDETWPELEPHLHSYVRQHLLGRVNLDPSNATLEQVREQALRVLTEARANHCEAVLREVLGQAQRNGRGAVGLRRVLRSLETGEVQTLLLGDKFEAPGVECINCGHLDFHMGESCAVCGQPVRQLSDIADALIGTAVRKGIEIIYVEQNAELEKVGHIGALLRFRSDQNTPMKQAS
jgi:peptide subunit release factor 1 (eRF1)